MKRKDVVDQVNEDFVDFTLSSPALKIRRLDTESAPIIIDEQAISNSVEFGQSMPIHDNFMEQSMESSTIPIDELKNIVQVNDERAIVLFNPKNNTPSLQSAIPFTISAAADSDFLSRFKNPVIWSNGMDTHKSITQNQVDDDDDDSGMIDGCLAVVPWVPSRSQHPQNSELEAPNAQTSDTMDSEAMDVEDDYTTRQMQKHQHVATGVNHDWNQWRPHCMIQQLPNNFSTPVTWLG